MSDYELQRKVCILMEFILKIQKTKPEMFDLIIDQLSLIILKKRPK